MTTSLRIVGVADDPTDEPPRGPAKTRPPQSEAEIASTNAAITVGVERMFGPEGMLVEAGREHRPPQLILARAIAQCFVENRCGMMEGATGVGKSAAYLTSALLAAAGGRRVVIAVGTNALIEQIRKDIPELQKLLGIHVPYGVLKGRAHYICGRNEDATRRTLRDEPLSLRLAPDEREQLAALLDWTRDGGNDLTQHAATLKPKVRKLVTISGEACKEVRAKEGCDFNDGRWLNGECIELPSCHLLGARIASEKAQLVITNFDVLLFNCRANGGIIGTFDTIIIDEAHELAPKIREFYSEDYAINTFETTADDLTKQLYRATASGTRNAGEAAADALATSSEEFSETLRKMAESRVPSRSNENSFETLVFAAGEPQAKLVALATRVRDACVAVVDAAKGIGLVEADVKKLDRRRTANRILTALDPLSPRNNFALSIKLDNMKSGVPRAYINLTPVSLARYMRDTIHASAVRREELIEAGEDRDAISAILAESARTSAKNDANVIAISATLTPDGTWAFPKSELAMPDDVITCMVDSPFDFGRNALWYMPPWMPESNNDNRDNYNRAASIEVQSIVRTVGGRTLVLCSRRDDMKVASDALRDPAAGGHRVLLQDDAPASQLTRDFKKDPTSCLVGSKTFRTGFDVPGSALECVVIWKLPYRKPTPVDELIAKRIGDHVWRAKIYTPEMLIELRQTIGRLLRQRTDIGVIVLMDVGRFARMRNQITGAMPRGIRLVRDIKQVEQFLRSVRLSIMSREGSR